MIRRILLVVALVVAPSVALAGRYQSPTPDARGEVVSRVPEYQGDRVIDPIPPELHIRNEGGSDGAGLCVISSVLVNGRHVGVPGLEGGKDSLLWRTAKSRPGGYSPDKLAALVTETVPGEKWASHVGRDPSVLDRLSREGYKIGATMNTGQLYGYRPIHHMISLDQYRSDGLAYVIDNNRPGFWSVMPAREFDRRWLDGGMGWAWIWTRKKAVVALASSAAGAVLCFGLAVVFTAAGKARRLELERSFP